MKKALQILALSAAIAGAYSAGQQDKLKECFTIDQLTITAVDEMEETEVYIFTPNHKYKVTTYGESGNERVEQIY